jgi:hypothetical protein
MPWGRFSNYEIADGAIRVAAGATFTPYDLAALWDDTQEGLVSYVPPTKAAIDLLGEIEAVEGTLKDRDEKKNELILEWCRTYGLFGLIGLRVLALNSPAWRAEVSGEPGWEYAEVARIGSRWRVDTVGTVGSDPPDESNHVQLVWEHYSETGGELGFDVENEAVSGALWFSFFLDPKTIRPMSATWSDGGSLTPDEESWYGSLRWRPESGPEYLGTEAFWYGFMLSEDFWRSYGEGVLDFVEALQRLRAALQGPDDRAWTVLTTGGVSWTVQSGPDGGQQLALASTNLLSLLLVAGLQDIGGEWRLQECRCGRVFMARHHLEKWHNTRCRERYKKRDQRSARVGEGE